MTETDNLVTKDRTEITDNLGSPDSVVRIEIPEERNQIAENKKGMNKVQTPKRYKRRRNLLKLMRRRIHKSVKRNQRSHTSKNNLS